MRAVREVFGWLGKQGLLYVLLVAAIFASAILAPWLKAEWTRPEIHRGHVRDLEQVVVNLRAARAAAQARVAAAGATAKHQSLQQLDEALRAARAAKAIAESQRRTAAAKALSLATFNGSELIADGRRELEIKARSAEIDGLLLARERLRKRDVVLGLLDEFRGQVQAVNRVGAAANAARASCAAASDSLRTFESRWPVWITGGLYDHKRLADLRAAKAKRCAEARHLRAVYDAQRAGAERARQAQAEASRAAQDAHTWTEARLTDVTSEIEQKISDEKTAVAGSTIAKLKLWSEKAHLPAILRQAAVALALIIAGPFLIRLLCFFVLAPLAMRRPAIRLRVPGGAGEFIPLAARSTTSVAVRLERDEELLVRQDYLQTTSHAGAKGTQWFLDWRHPITSLATGLTFLTRIRGEGETTTVSAVRDPFAEVTIVTLPDGAACVLHPRALAAVAQPIGRRLRERGRVFGQDQLVGFSADLGYLVTRTETFWPYFLGREQLLKDRVEAGTGVLIVE